MAVAQQATAEIVLTEVTEAVGLDFMGDYGPTFPEIVDPVLVIMQRNTGNGVAVADFDRDGDLDVYLTGNSGVSNRLYRNELMGSENPGTATFVDITAEAFSLGEGETHDLGLSRAASFADLDGDDDLDLVVLSDDNGSDDPEQTWFSRSRLFRNLGDGTFEDATAGSGFRPIGYLRAGLSLADYDLDGRLDIYATVWTAAGRVGDPQFLGTNRLYRNLGGMQFEDVTDEVGLGGVGLDSFSAIFSDFDTDGDPDLFVAMDHSTDLFYFNDEGIFSEEASSVGLTHVGNDMGIAAADYDDDDDLDLFVTNITEDPDNLSVEQGNAFWIDEREGSEVPMFVDRARELGVFNAYWGWGTQFIDVENDGDLDLAAVNGFDELVEFEFPNSPGENALYYNKPSTLFVNDGTGSFILNHGTEFDETPDDSRALVAFDYDRDGDQDLLVTNVDGPTRLYENQSTDANHWLEVRLEPDRLAIGAIVRATVLGATAEDDVVRRRDILAGRSYLAGTPSEVHFGLGAAQTVDLLEIQWADGSTALRENVSADQILRIVYVPEPATNTLRVAMAVAISLLARRRRR